jgi:hypothetical protein
VPISRAVQLIKGGSSKWIHQQFPAFRDFAWQEGYGAFSIGVSQLEITRNQERHHGTMTFQEEFLRFLAKHKIHYDPMHVWG